MTCSSSAPTSSSLILIYIYIIVSYLNVRYRHCVASTIYYGRVWFPALAHICPGCNFRVFSSLVSSPSLAHLMQNSSPGLAEKERSISSFLPSLARSVLVLTRALGDSVRRKMAGSS